MKYLKNNNWIFALIILLFISASYYQGNVRWYRMYNRGGISVGNDTVSGTNIPKIDSITYASTHLGIWSSGTDLLANFDITSSLTTQLGLKANIANQAHTGNTTVANLLATILQVGASGGTIDSISFDGAGGYSVWDGANQLSPLFNSTATGDLGDYSPLLTDTIPRSSYGLGAYVANDTTAVVVGTLLGSFYWGHDTLQAGKLIGAVQGSGSPTANVAVFWSDTLNDATPTGTLVSALTLNSTTVGNSTTTFTNAAIPPGNWIWSEISGVTAGSKPTYITLTLEGYIKRD